MELSPLPLADFIYHYLINLNDHTFKLRNK